jgi:hypothetical protein
MECVGGDPYATKDRLDDSTPGHCMLGAFQHKNAGTFAQNETVAVCRKWT